MKLTFERRRLDGTFVALEREVKRERRETVRTRSRWRTMLDSTRPATCASLRSSVRRSPTALHDALNRENARSAARHARPARQRGRERARSSARRRGIPAAGTIVYTQEGGRRTSPTRDGCRGALEQRAADPIVVMVNAGTASASELVAGALQDHDRALIVGRPTFGKSLLMRGFPMSDGSTIVARDRTGAHALRARGAARVSHDLASRLLSSRTRGARHSGSSVVQDGRGTHRLRRWRHLSRTSCSQSAPPRPRGSRGCARRSLPLKWLGAYVTAAGGSLPTLDQLAANPHLPPTAIAQFREFATHAGVTIPAGSEADSLFERTLVRGVARIKWGDAATTGSRPCSTRTWRRPWRHSTARKRSSALRTECDRLPVAPPAGSVYR